MRRQAANTTFNPKDSRELLTAATSHVKKWFRRAENNPRNITLAYASEARFKQAITPASNLWTQFQARSNPCMSLTRQDLMPLRRRQRCNARKHIMMTKTVTGSSRPWRRRPPQPPRQPAAAPRMRRQKRLGRGRQGRRQLIKISIQGRKRILSTMMQTISERLYRLLCSGVWLRLE